MDFIPQLAAQRGSDGGAGTRQTLRGVALAATILNLTPAQFGVLEKIDALPRYDYEQYLKDLKGFSTVELTLIYSDWRLYRRAFCWIIEKTTDGKARPVRFHPKGWQAEYENTRGLNDIFLKLRKTGCSTDIMMEMYSKAVLMGHQRQIMMSHEEDSTKRLLEVLKTTHEMNPQAPPLSKSNTSGMQFAYTKSTIWIGTAGARVFGRGDDLTLAHLSEAAHFYKRVGDAPTFMAGISEAIAKGGRFVIESTPNGEDPIFWEHWQAAKNGELWHGHFLSIFDDENTNWGIDHPLTLPSTATDDFQMSEYEQSLLHNQKGATLGHIRFIRYEKEKMLAKSSIDPGSSFVMGDEQMLLQEYPVDDTTCFLTSKDAVFDTGIVNIYRQRSKPPLFVEENGGLKIWEKAIAGRAYVLFIDPSEGLPTSHWQAGAVLDVSRNRYVATLRVRTDLVSLAYLAVGIATRYNHALLMVERNNHGHAVLATIESIGYDNIYFHREHSNALRSGEMRQGWPTRASDTKPLMIQTFTEAFNAGALELDDLDALREISQYRFFDPRTKGGQGKGRYGPPSGGTDDLLDCLMGCLMGREFASTGQRAPVTHYGVTAGARRL